MKGKIAKFATAFASFAFAAAIFTNGAASIFYLHEPEMPECLK